MGWARAAGLLSILAAAATAVGHYNRDEYIPVYVNKVGPYSNIDETYHYYSLPLCRPEKIEHKSLSLGQVLAGDRMAESSFRIRADLDKVEKQSLCLPYQLSAEDANQLVEAIEGDYYFELIVDDLRVRAFVGHVTELEVIPHAHVVSIYTHYLLRMEYRKDEDGAIEIITVSLLPSSPKPLEHDKPAELSLSYGVEWVVSNGTMADRHDSVPLVSSAGSQVHWLSVLNSALLAVFLTGFVLVIVLSSVRRDLSRYDSPGDGFDEDPLMENGWKTVGMDVFRTPRYPMLYSAIIGVGAQLLVFVGTVLLIGSLNVMSVHRHGLINTISVIVYAWTSGVAGFVSSHRYACWSGTRWVANIHATSLLFVAPLVACWAITNTVQWAHGGTQALPWTTVTILVAIWVVFGYTLTVLGGLAGKAMADKKAIPCRIRAIPRQLPSLPWIHSTPAVSVMAGILPFCSIVIELMYVFSTLWGHEQYTLWYIVLIMYCLLIVVVACVSVSQTYMQLNREDYHWWWRSVCGGGSLSLFVFVFGVYFFCVRSRMHGLVQSTQFLCCLLLLSYTLFLSMATVAYAASWRFVKFLYSSVKTD